MSTTIELQDGQRTRNVKGRVFRFGGGGRECICRMVFAYKYEEKLHGKSFKYLDCQLLDLFLKALIWIKTNCGKFLKRWEYQATSPSSWEISMRVRKQQLELDIGQWTGSKLGKEYVKAIYCHLAYLTYMHVKYVMQNARLDKSQTGIKIASLWYADDTTWWRKVKRN